MFLNNPGGDGQAQASPAFFGREERIKKALLDGRRNASAGICDGDYSCWERAIVTVGLDQPQGDGAVPANAVSRVLDQVNQDLLELLGVGLNPDWLLNIPLQLNGRRFQFRLHERIDFIQYSLRRNAHQLGLGWPGKLKEIFDNPVKAIEFLADDPRVFILSELDRKSVV